MKKFTRIFLSLLITVAGACQNASHRANTIDTPQSETMKDTVALSTSMTDVSDVKFIIQTRNSSSLEIALAKIAQDRTKNRRVKDYAIMLERDHTASNQQLDSIASLKKVLPALQTDNEGQEKVSEFSEKKGADFDKSYIDKMVEDHKKAIADFEKEYDTGKDGDLQRFAMATLPTLKSHLDSAMAIQLFLKKK